MESLWNDVRGEYKLCEQLGAGSYGQVVKAKHRATKQVVAIKLIKDVFKDSFQTRKILREIKIMRKLAKMK